jgi:ACR3 family arsenite transporter
MAVKACISKSPGGLGFFERWLTLWVLLCIAAGILMGRLAPGIASALDSLSVMSGGAPVISIPIAVCLFFMMYPIMVKIDFGEVVRAGRNIRPVGLTLFVNWMVKPFTMLGISLLFLGVLFRGLIGPDAVDLVKLPAGLDLPVGAVHGIGTVVLENGIKMLQIPLWRSYLAGCILLGIAPCTAMVSYGGSSPEATTGTPS